MKRKVKNLATVTLSILTILFTETHLTNGNSNAQEITFVCGIYENTPATIARTPTAEKPMILWNSDRLGPSEASPEELCQQVSAQLQLYHSKGELNYITTGRMNGQLVACVAETEGGGCVNSLFALNPERKPNTSLERIFRIRIPSSSAITETNAPLYLELDKYLHGEYAELNLQPNNSPDPEEAGSR